MQRNKHSIAAIDRVANWGLPAWQAQKGDGEGGGMPCESPPKFMVCFLSCSFKFSTSTLEFYSWIHYFTLFLWNSHHWKRFYTRLLAFELNFFIWPCSLYIFHSTNKYSFNFNATYFHSTQIFILLQLKLFSFNKKISIQLQLKLFLFNKKIFIQLLYLKFTDADIPDVYSTKTARPLPNSVNVWHTDPVSWDALKWRRTGWLKWHLLLRHSLRSRRLEVVGERENGRARGRHAKGEGAASLFPFLPILSPTRSP